LNMYIWMFQRHCHILKELYEFFVYDGCHIHIWRTYFHISFCGYGLVIKSVGLGAHLRKWQRKQNIKRWMWIFLHDDLLSNTPSLNVPRLSIVPFLGGKWPTILLELSSIVSCYRTCLPS
jgi:hypothetical protein